MSKKYIFHSSCFDKELLRKQLMCLNDNFIDYQIINKEEKTDARSPLGGYFESEIHILESDFERADSLLMDILERFK